MMTMLQAGMACAVTQMRPNVDSDSLPRAMKANRRIVRFLKEQEAELKAKHGQMSDDMGDP